MFRWFKVPHPKIIWDFILFMRRGPVLLDFYVLLWNQGECPVLINLFTLIRLFHFNCRFLRLSHLLFCSLLSLVVKFKASFLKSLVYIVRKIIEKMSGHTRIQRISEGHLDVVNNLTLVLIKFLNFPAWIQTLENSAVVCLWQNPIGVLIAYSRYVSKA